MVNCEPPQWSWPVLVLTTTNVMLCGTSEGVRNVKCTPPLSSTSFLPIELEAIAVIITSRWGDLDVIDLEISQSETQLHALSLHFDVAKLAFSSR